MEYEMRDCYLSFLDAQQKRMEAFESGDYELDEDEGYHCLNCGWRGLSAPLSEDEYRIVDCPECENAEFKDQKQKVEHFQNFGYKYEKFPEDIKKGREEDHLITE